ncbi:hypothetical protein ACFL5O_01915 [Myxococcota bacterium]
MSTTSPPASLSLPAAAEVVLTFLDSLGRRSEAELYLRLFRQLPRESFAIVVTEAQVIRHALGVLLEHLKFLSELGLFAPVVLGATSPDTAERGAAQLGSHLPRVGLASSLHPMTTPDLADCVRAELMADRVPLLWFGPSGPKARIDRWVRIGRLADELGSRKLVLVRQRGSLALRDNTHAESLERLGILGPAGELSVVNLRTDRDLLLGPRLLTAEEARVLRSMQSVLEAAGLGTQLTVSVTSPLNLLRELFTVRGDGTLIKLGTDVRRYFSYQELDVERLRGLLEKGFQRPLQPEFFTRTPSALYLESSYRGAAIVESSQVAPYLSKLAVDPVAQGEGIGRDLWQALGRDHSQLVWRSRRASRIATWYASQCDGMVRCPDWNVYWRGLEHAQIPEAISEALARPEDFVPRLASASDARLTDRKPRSG